MYHRVRTMGGRWSRSRTLIAAGAAALVAIFALQVLESYQYDVLYLRLLTQTGNAFAARLACSIVFGAHRQLESAVNHGELYIWGLGRNFSIDRQCSCVTTNWIFKQSYSSRACFQGHRLGCHLMQENSSSCKPPDTQNFARGQNIVSWKKSSKGLDTSRLEEIVGAHFADSRLASRAFLLIHKNQIIFEQYGEGFNENTRLHGWSMTKSLLNALIGVRLRQGKLGFEGMDSRMSQFLDLGKFPGLKGTTIRDMLHMSDSLDFDETYLPGSKVLEMLFLRPSATSIAAGLKRRQGKKAQRCFQYSSLTTNLLSRALRSTFENRSSYFEFADELFETLGMESAGIETDGDGVLIASSFGWATARDWARFALLYSNNGQWWKNGNGYIAEGELFPVLPEGWVNFSRTPAPTSRGIYSAHFWL